MEKEISSISILIMQFLAPLMDKMLYFLVNSMRIPYLGRNVISGFNTTLWPGAKFIFHRLQIVAIKRIASNHANGSPMQPLTPPPKGK
jgi:hypothetical protein